MNFSSSFDLNDFDGRNGFSRAGDVNDDGVADIVIGRSDRDTNAAPESDGIYAISVQDSSASIPPLVDGKLATIFVNDDGIIVGSAQQSGASYQGSLVSVTDNTSNTDDIIVGTEGNDFIFSGNQGEDIVVAGAGNDTIGWGDRPDDSGELSLFTVNAGAGDDFVYTAGDDLYRDAVVDLGSGNDVFYTRGAQGNTFTRGPRVMVTGSGNNVIGIGRRTGNVTTGSGDDFVYTTADNALYGLNLGDGNNAVWLQQGSFSVFTGRGDDVIGIGSIGGVINAGDGDNIIYTVDSDSELGAGVDIVTGMGSDYVEAGKNGGSIDAGTGLNTLISGAGSDTFTLRIGAYNYIEDFAIAQDFLALADVSFESLNFYQGSVVDGGQSSTYIFADGNAIAEITNTTVDALNNIANFV